jgi:hypothetical protein
MLMKLTLGPLRCFKMSVKSKRFKIIRKGTENTLRAIKIVPHFSEEEIKLSFKCIYKLQYLNNTVCTVAIFKAILVIVHSRTIFLKVLGSKATWQRSIAYNRQFHQHFTRVFFGRNFGTKNSKAKM